MRCPLLFYIEPILVCIIGFTFHLKDDKIYNHILKRV